jgi:2-oxoglutarate dehydrogenase E1 component
MNSSVSSRLSADLLEQKYERWLDDPQSVEPTWVAFFEGFELGTAQTKHGAAARDQPVEPVTAPADGEHQLSFRGRVVSLVYNYRTLGHTQAHINPLMDEAPRNPRLALSQFGFSDADLGRDASTQFFRAGETMTLAETVGALEETYSGQIGFEFMHIHNTELRNWIRERIEARVRRTPVEAEEKKKAHGWLLQAELFESFLGKKFLGEKRFSLEGGEGVMVLLNRILEQSPRWEVKAVEMGMAHRGRLNVLAQVVGKSLRTILYEFTPNYVPDLVAGDGDVKYHLGYQSVREFPDGEVLVALAANPSHLEAVNAVVEGKARARQRLIADADGAPDRARVLPLLIHGDAAFAGQGSVAEVLNLSQLPGYRTGGTIHVIINNQIGFTTMPADARSSSYATDVAKMIEAPILHVNGENPEEMFWAAEFAMEFRQTWARDVILDMYCYRRQGHNENDQAAFTQPHIYRQIGRRKPVGQLFGDRLVEAGTMTRDEVQQVHDRIWDQLEQEYQEMKRLEEQGERTVFSGSTAEAQPRYSHEPVPTGVTKDVIARVGRALTDIPDGFGLHPTLAKRFIPRRLEALKEGGPIDWAFAESLAFGALLDEGTPVRLSGQDCRRGTFSQRHAVFYDHQTRDRYIPLDHVSDGQAKFCVYNSLLSEAAVLGFDYGYSRGCPQMLIMWEAQFGDFVNGAQVIIDQFISSAESKWQTPSSIVLLLPHGYDGMGPEHSSARLERFLQLCADKNMIVGNLTTPAQYFHVLRRQILRPVKKPLVLMTPKSLLTRVEAVSAVGDFLEGTAFLEMLPDPGIPGVPEDIERVVFCSGKVFYDLHGYRNEQKIDNTALIRIEQLYPFHEEMLKELVAPYRNATKWVWCQEEPLNMGAWSYIGARLQDAVDGRVRYAGRDRASSPATGSKAVHLREQKMLVEEAFEV